MRHKFFGALLGSVLVLNPGLPGVAMAEEGEREIQVITEELPIFKEPHSNSPALFHVYHGMTLKVAESVTQEGDIWYRLKTARDDYWLKGTEQGKNKIGILTEERSKTITDSYGILDLPHRFAAKLVKLPEAKGQLETYEKKGNHYELRYVYPVTYAKEGPKTTYGDLKTVGGPIIRYMYRTLKTNMEGRDQTGREFGVYKISYPLPHDVLPYFLGGRMTVGMYNAIPMVNDEKGLLKPHPHSLAGADILIHTARKGSRGCINVENELMSALYLEDLVTENDREIIPLVIYDEDMSAPPVGKLF